MRKLKVYALLPEMRLFWLLLPAIAVLSLISIWYLPGFLVFVTLGLFVLLIAFTLFGSLRLARINLEVKVERNQLWSVVNNLRDGIIAYDTDFRLLIFNRAAEAIFDIPAAEVVGKVFSPDSSRTIRSSVFAQAMFPSLAPLAVNRSEPGAPVQVVDLSFDVPRLELRVSSARISDPAGKLLGFLKIVNDRTREVEVQRSKSEFITVVAHQLRTPLSAIQWTFESLKGESGISDPGKQFVENGLKASEKVLKIVNDLLDVSKIEEGRFGFQFEAVEVVSFFEKILEEAAAFAAKYGVSVYFEKPEAPSLVLTIDAPKIAMAVNNLIDNAVRYNVPNGKVTVSLQPVKDSPYIQVSVSDTGVGIPEEDRAKLFSRFYRGKNASQVETEGSGLGLYIAKNIITRHGGKIQMESEMNRGTTISFTLPTDPSLIHSKDIVSYDD